MIATLEKETLAELWANRCGPARITILMPLAEPGPERRQDPIRLQNLIAKIRKDLSEGQRKLLDPVESVLEQKPFWNTHYQGVAILSGPDDFLCIGLDFKPEPQAVVGERYQLLPLLTRPARHVRTVLISLHRGAAKLYRGQSPQTLEPWDLPIPNSIEEINRWERKAGLATTKYTDSRPTPGSEVPLHGGNQMDRLQPEWDQRFVNQVFRKLRQELDSSALLVVDCSTELESLCHDCMKELPYPWLDLDHRTDEATLDQIRSAVDTAVQAWKRERLAEEIRKVRELPPQLRSSQLDELLKAGAQGRIKRLFVCPEATVSDERFEKLILSTLSHSGELIGCRDEQLPERVMGVYRWSH